MTPEDHGQATDLAITERGYTFKDMRFVSMFARLEGAPATVEEIIRDLDAQGKLSAPTNSEAVDALVEIKAKMDRIVAGEFGGLDVAREVSILARQAVDRERGR